MIIKNLEAPALVSEFWFTRASQASEDQVAEKTTLLGFIVWRIKPECLIYRGCKVLG